MFFSLLVVVCVFLCSSCFFFCCCLRLLLCFALVYFLLPKLPDAGVCPFCCDLGDWRGTPRFWQYCQAKIEQNMTKSYKFSQLYSRFTKNNMDTSPGNTELKTSVTLDGGRWLLIFRGRSTRRRYAGAPSSTQSPSISSSPSLPTLSGI